MRHCTTLRRCRPCRRWDALAFMAELHLAAGLDWKARGYLTDLVVQAGGAVA